MFTFVSLPFFLSEVNLLPIPPRPRLIRIVDHFNKLMMPVVAILLVQKHIMKLMLMQYIVKIDINQHKTLKHIKH